MVDNNKKLFSDNDELLFSEEETIVECETETEKPWKIIIADDQEEIHSVTKLVLDDFTFQNRGLIFLSAYSGEETKKFVRENDDVAFILLDVVMETDDAGLEVVRYIREELQNTIVQIVLNTGQPGQAPEQEVITRYDINDYKSKTEFNARKLLTSVTASLRAYSLSHNLHQANVKLSRYQNHLEELVQERTAELEETNRKLKLEINERIKVEKALQQSNEVQRNILSASPIGICLVNNKSIVWINDEMVKMFGFTSADEYQGKGIRIFYPSDHEYQRVKAVVTENLKANKPVKVDAVFQREDKSTFSGNLKISGRDMTNYMNQSVITISDITWRLQAEQDRIQKERLQGALEMSGSVCHELNQPLQYVSGATEILLMDLPEDDPLYETMGKIKSQVDRMGAITKKLMGITSYKTREYVGGRQIIDIDKASELHIDNCED
ncbi:MAG: PAS domain S-box protein [Desulfobacteraceae bacterium]|nr:MAG: PAS domain S-box protein [Desulfobacteraceae bacterium]